MKTIMTALATMSLFASTGFAHPPEKDDATAHYLANEGVMVVAGETKILFDPLFHNSYGQYQLLPEEMRAKLMAGEAPYDGIDAIFISHAHGDHFDAADVNKYLAAYPDVKLVAPSQAVEALKTSTGWKSEFSRQIETLSLSYDDRPYSVLAHRIPRGQTASVGTETHSLLDWQAVRIPHAGGPSRAAIQNMVYRVTLDYGATVLHLGDATPDAEAFAPYKDHWATRLTHMAFVPDWFFGALGGEATREMLNAEKAVGVHVRSNVPQALKESGEDYFSIPGETRIIIISPED